MIMAFVRKFYTWKKNCRVFPQISHQRIHLPSSIFRPLPYFFSSGKFNLFLIQRKVSIVKQAIKWICLGSSGFSYDFFFFFHLGHRAADIMYLCSLFSLFYAELIMMLDFISTDVSCKCMSKWIEPFDFQDMLMINRLRYKVPSENYESASLLPE